MIDEQLMKFFGITAAQIASVTGATLAATEFLKRLFPRALTGTTTTALAAAVSLTTSVVLAYPSFPAIGALALIGVVFSGGSKALIKKIGK